METVLITGGSGLIGSRLSSKLSEAGYRVALLSRKPEEDSPWQVFSWDIQKGTIDPGAVECADYIIHLAGANIGEKRWTESRKKEIVGSRVKSTELLFKYFAGSGKLKAFISASATGWYGAVTSDKIFTEEDPAADDFLGQTCRYWEEAAGMFEKSGFRTSMIRTGIVLSPGGGALGKMALPVRLGVGSALGSGRQYMPWVHLDDLCNIYLRAISDNNFHGAYNAVAPGHVNGKEFVSVIAKTLRKPLWFPNVPAFMLRAIFGELAVMLLEGSRVSPDKLLKTGFSFNYPDLGSALEQLYS